MQQFVVVGSGLVLGGFAGAFWYAVTSRIDTKPLFTALGRSMRAMLSDDSGFLREYAALLMCVGSFVFWNVLALAGAIIPLVLVWPAFERHHVLLVVVYSLASMAGVYALRACTRRRRPSEDRGGLSVSDSQFFFLQVIESAPGFMRTCGDFETRLLRKRLNAIDVDRPIFITGLARSGTTMLLELLAQVDTVATHRYRDFPFLTTPYYWNRFFQLFGGNPDSVQRPHQDGIQITPESPEAFEEPLWQTYFPNAHQAQRSHVLTRSDENKAFNEFFTDHLKKLLLIRRGTRYVSKGNYNLTRIEYIASLFPDARFVVPIRHPITHVTSLVRQHELFCEYSQNDRRVPLYLAAAGHFEFGPQRVPISVDGSADKTLAAWNAGDEPQGYAVQWAAVYGFVFDLLARSPELAERVMIVRYEDLCDRPYDEVSRVLTHVGLADEGAAILAKLDHVKPAKPHGKTEDDSIAQTVWNETAAVAARFGYTFAGHDGVCDQAKSSLTTRA